ncbi:hypothetical protein Vafri_21405 [Volvox africanus]|uniref:Protein kinase domain-containing protein n=1 Tax=Volvox africanus TaxID=51714 RepID=A0A8J4BYT7_9CHLO|nr:hypothetical protein Vafri_21405 [Volvox africanus]
MSGNCFRGTVRCFVTVSCCFSAFLAAILCRIPRCSHYRPRELAVDEVNALRGRSLRSKEDAVALVSNAQQFVLALAEPSIELVIITSEVVDVSSAAWNSSGVNLPIELRRNITIEGDPRFAQWPVLNFNYIKGVARLAGGCHLAFRNLVLMYFREQPTRAIGMDFLLPTLPGELSFLFANNTALIEGVCFPQEIRSQDFGGLSRPSQFPGDQNVTATLPQDGCVNDTTAYPLRRCWAGRGYIQDLVTECADLDPVTQSTKFNNQIAWVLNCPAICEYLVDYDCLTVQQKEPLVCYLEAKKMYNAARSPKVPVSVENEKESGDRAGLTGRSRVAVISATTIGGTLVVITVVIGLAAAVSWRRHGRRAVTWRNAFATGNDNGSSSTLEGAKLASEHGITKGACGGDNNEGQQEAAGSNTDPESAALPAGESDMEQDTSNEEKINLHFPADGRDKHTRSGHQVEDRPVTLLTPPRAEVVLDVQVAQEQEQKLETKSQENKTPKIELLPTVLGKGSFGRVVEGLYNGRRVAVKLMTSDALWEQAGRQENIQQHQQDEQEQAVGLSNVFVQSFVQEVQVLSRCQHPNIVQLVAACVTPPRLCLVMELMETSLERFLYGKASLRSTECIPLEKVLWIGIGISNALAYLHPTIMHRDLKPANVLINAAASDKPVVKLTDFGLSRLRMTVRSTKHPDAGTPPYMAPECFDLVSRCISHQSDIYSLGVMLWEMLAGERPWHGMGGVAIAFMVTYRGIRLPLHGLAPSRCAPKLARLLMACWDADPARRPAAAEMAKELTLIEEQYCSRGRAHDKGASK